MKKKLKSEKKRKNMPSRTLLREIEIIKKSLNKKSEKEKMVFQNAGPVCEILTADINSIGFIRLLLQYKSEPSKNKLATLRRKRISKPDPTVLFVEYQFEWL